MSRPRGKRLKYEVVELDGVRYAILRENLLKELCRRGGTECSSSQPSTPASELAGMELDQEKLARRLTARRKRAGLTQAELAGRAGIRVETLNRVERGRTMPDFSTVRKLVVAMSEAEAEAHSEALAGAPDAKEPTSGSNHEP